MSGGRYGNDVRAHAEIFDPATYTWTATATPMTIGRAGHSLTQLADGRVLAAGGWANPGGFVTSAEIYDPATGAWSPIASMSRGKWQHTATRMPDGRVFVVGGENYSDGGGPHFAITEYFDPATGTWSPGPTLNVGRADHQAAFLPDGRFIVVGGIHGFGAGAALSSTEILNGFSWQLGPPMAEGRVHFPMTLLSDGTLLVTGGTTGIDTSPQVVTPGTERFDPATNTWAAGALLNTPRRFHVSAQLPDGRVIVAAGQDSVDGLLTTEVSGGDTTAPWTTATPSQPPNLNGWYNADVTIALQATDPGGSGVQSIVYSVVGRQSFGTTVPGNSTSLTISAEGTSTLTYHAIDQAGNAEPDHTLTIRIDRTAPSTTYWAPPANANGWNRFDVFVNLQASDNMGGSGLQITHSLSGAQSGGGTAAGSFASFSIVNEGTTTVTYRAADQAGNTEADRTFVVRLDKSQPAVAPIPSQTVNATSASGAVVSFDVSASDFPSGIDTVSALPLQSGATFPHGTTNETVVVTDKAGNSTFRSFNVTVNKALVSISVAPSSATIDVGDQQPFQATGHFTDGTTAILPSSGGGGGGGNSFPAGGDLHIHFDSQFPTGGCSPGHGGFSSQSVFLDASGGVNATFGNPAIIQATGTATPQQVNLALTCISTNAPHGSIVANWAGTSYSGTWTVGASTGALTIRAWSSRPSMPTPRYALGAATVNGIVYAIGGAATGTLLGTVEAYDPAANTWTPRAPMPTPREGAGVAALNGLIYAAGGHSAGGVATGIVEAYDPVTNTWAPVASMSPRAHLALVAAGNALYAIGGDSGPNNGLTTGLVERYDPAANQWTAMAPLAIARNFLVAGALDGGTLIAVAGGAGTSTELYNVAANTWSAGPPMLSAQSGATAAVTNNAMYVFGTTNSNGNRTTHMFRPANGLQFPAAWLALAKMPTGRAEAAAAAVGTDIYVTGGQVNSQAIAPAPLEVFSAPPPFDFSPSFGGGSSLPVPQWSSTNPSVAGVNASGFAVGVGTGQTTIVATANGISCAATGTCATLTVVDPECAAVVLSITGNVPFNTISLSANGDPDPIVVPFGVHTFTLREGSYTVEFFPPPGYQVTPNPVTFTVGCGDTAQVSVVVAPIDTTPPVLTLPADITVPAASPAGAAVTFAASALDAVDGPTAVACSPASGWLFAAGTTTTVTCSSSDAAGNTATGTFSVTVLNAQQIVSALLGELGGFQQGSNLLQNALSSMANGNAGAACNQLGAFIDQVQAQAATLIGLAQSARAALGCS